MKHPNRVQEVEKTSHRKHIEKNTSFSRRLAKEVGKD